MINSELEEKRIAKSYLMYFNKYSNKKMFMRDPLNSKWGIYFKKIVSLFGRNSEWDADRFVKANFEENGLVYPAQLTIEKAWKTYLDYLPKYKSKETSMEDGIIATLEKINKYNTMEEFISKSHIFLLNDNFSKYVLYFSKSYLKWAKENNFLKDSVENIKIKRVLVRRNVSLNNKIKESLKDDYV